MVVVLVFFCRFFMIKKAIYALFLNKIKCLSLFLALSNYLVLEVLFLTI